MTREAARQALRLKIHPIFQTDEERVQTRQARHGDTSWTRRYTSNSSQNCVRCIGLGTVTGYGNKPRLCACVLRRIFRQLVDRYHVVGNTRRFTSTPNLETVPSGSDSTRTWGRKDEEYRADLWLLGKRILEPVHWQIFRRHQLGCEDSGICASLGLNRGNFFHAVYEIEERVARAAIELEPYALYPIDQYLSRGNGRGRRLRQMPLQMPKPQTLFEQKAA
jgi:hypothetical protein